MLRRLLEGREKASSNHYRKKEKQASHSSPVFGQTMKKGKKK
jgi:hypothetical protein